MRIGVPKEIKTLEFRVGATPGRGPAAVSARGTRSSSRPPPERASALPTRPTQTWARRSCPTPTRCSRPPT